MIRFTLSGSVNSSARSSSSIQRVFGTFPSHCLQNGRETPSTLLWTSPGRCSISYVGQSFYPASHYAFRYLKGLQPFETVVVSP